MGEVEARRVEDEADVLRAHHVLEYPYSRSVGPVLGRFFTSMRDGRFEGVEGDGGRVLMPPSEYDPVSSRPTGGPVPLPDTGVVTTWTWVESPGAGHPLDRPFAFALVRLDGADTAFLHAVDAGSPAAMSSGMRVRARWRDREERVGHVSDVMFFVPEAGE